MRNKLLVGTAALVASITIAAAQNAPNGSGAGEHRPQPNVAQQRGQEHRQAQQPSGRAGQERAQQGADQRQGASSRGEAQRSQTTGQAPQTTQEEHGQAQRQDEHEGHQASGQKEQNQPQSRAKPQTQSQQSNKREGNEARRQHGQAAAANQRQGKQATGQAGGQQGEQRAQHDGNRTVGAAQRDQQPKQGNEASGEHSEASQQGTVTLSAQDQEKIRTSLLSGRNVPRIDRVDFSLNIGTVIPQRVEIASVPEAVIAIYPQWRGDSYFVVRDEIIIVDHDHRIVASVPTGTARAEFDNRGTAFNGGTVDIREVQTALIREGYDIGTPDGIMGPRTKQALMTFQRRQGFKATGEIDRQTFAALRANGTEGRPGNAAGANQPSNANQPSTTGQGRNDREPSSAARAPSSKPQSSANEPSANKAPANPGRNQPATTGQAAPSSDSKQPGTPKGEEGFRENKGANTPAENSRQGRELSGAKSDQQK